MNGDSAGIDLLLNEILAELKAVNLPHCDLLVFPAYVYLAGVVSKLRGSGIGAGAQDVDRQEGGAVTGGVSAAMLRDVGCEYVIVGHSERRGFFAESDEVVADKFEQCLANRLKPILCVGETLDERKSGRTLSVVARQVQAVIAKVGADGMRTATIAYEPVWAIGTGESATPEQAEDVHKSLRACLAEADAGIAESTRVLYGGSVTPENAGALFAKQHVDGALVGGASLNGKGFVEICKAADNSSG